MQLHDELLRRLAVYADAGSTDDIRESLERVAVTPANRWRTEWIELLFPGLPPDLSQQVRALAAANWMSASRDPDRVQRLRALFRDLGIDAFLLPNADEHQGRDVPADARRLLWLTGFSGSAGTAVIARDAAWLFVDGRYILQAQGEVDRSVIEPRHFQKPPMWQFLAGALPAAGRLGYDPRLHPTSEIATAKAALEPAAIELVPLEGNPIDRLWTVRPPRPFSAVVPHPDQLAGRSSEEKRAEVSELLRTRGAQAVVLNQLESVAWLFNIRAGDAAHTPVVQSYAIAHADGHAELFLERSKLTRQAIQHLGNHTTVHDLDAFEQALADIGRRGLTVAIDRDKATQRLELVLRSAGANVVAIADPTLSLRMRKNKVELDNLREALARDGAALAKFLCWLSDLPHDTLPDELELAERVTAFRAEDPTFRGPSFPPIVGVGPNGAIIHYHPTPETNRRLAPHTLLLIDSGGQYLAGTTDLTRTLCVGAAPSFERQVFTTVLKSHIALALARFPKGTTGAQLDGIARAPLWRFGVEFDHGTGHGIGSYLSVHEGSVRIAGTGDKPFDVHYVTSNEPGAYFAGRFGVRLENTMIVVESAPGLAGEPFLEFETASVVPFARDLIDMELLTGEERLWLDRYHAKVRETVAPFLQGRAADWLEAATGPL